MSFFDRRVLFVVGKGGTGKTTVSVSLALAAQKLGKKVLLLEIGDEDAIGQSFKLGPLTNTPMKLDSSIKGARVNGRLVLEEYVHEHVGFHFIANRITRSKIFEHTAEATPGLKEVMNLGQIWRYEQEKDSNGDPNYDIIIVDAPATGHGVSLLRLPQALIDMLKVGPIVEQTRVVQKLFQNQSKTWLILVTIPEELPVKEALEFKKIALNTLKMPVQMTLINCVYDQLFNKTEEKQIDDLLSNLKDHDEDQLKYVVFETARRQIVRKNLQELYIKQLRKELIENVIEIPFFFTNEIKIQEANQIASIILHNFKKI